LSLPLLGEHDGVLAIRNSFQSWQNWLTCEQFPPESEHHRIVDEIRLCFAGACDIYVRRATCDDSPSSSAHPQDPQDNSLQSSAIQALMARISRISPHDPGAHALVWPCFVAGAEASETHQRTFFVDYMNSIYARTKFRNIPLAVQSLENIWSSERGTRWTLCLPEISNVLVM
jgi:hypothetical protein